MKNSAFAWTVIRSSLQGTDQFLERYFWSARGGVGEVIVILVAYTWPIK